MKFNNDFYKITTLILLVVLIVIGGFWLVGKYNIYKISKQNEVFVAGYNQGVSDAIVKLYQDTEDCNVASVFIGNLTRRVADVECIEKITR
ncbi:hypothetical protein GOV08_01760 [Candidatus Woesearchaeota archaeon]|nr:hypothetical protein [Candidatus Woesearchaeota archaeon]